MLNLNKIKVITKIENILFPISGCFKKRRRKTNHALPFESHLKINFAFPGAHRQMVLSTITILELIQSSQRACVHE